MTLGNAVRTVGSSVAPARRSVRSSVRLSLRTAAAVGLALGAVCATATPGSAHARLVGTDPEDGARLTATPRVVTLTFSDPIDPQFVRIRLAGPGSAPLPITPQVVKGVVTVKVPSTMAGRYSVSFRVVSTDGHPVSGTVSFIVTGAPPVSPSLAVTGAPTSAPTGTPTGPSTGSGTPTTAPTTTSPTPTPTTPTPTTPTPTPADEPTSETSYGAPTGLLVGLGAVIVALGAAAWFAVGRRRR